MDKQLSWLPLVSHSKELRRRMEIGLRAKQQQKSTPKRRHHYHYSMRHFSFLEWRWRVTGRHIWQDSTPATASKTAQWSQITGKGTPLTFTGSGGMADRQRGESVLSTPQRSVGGCRNEKKQNKKQDNNYSIPTWETECVPAVESEFRWTLLIDGMIAVEWKPFAIFAQTVPRGHWFTSLQFGGLSVGTRWRRSHYFGINKQYQMRFFSSFSSQRDDYQWG